jgi:serine/threonine protein kinase
MSFSPFYLVFEYMDHDLAATPGLHFMEPQVKCFMAHILVELRSCHERCVLHRDIKGANLLIDGDGHAQDRRLRPRHLLHAARPQPLTSRIITLWYRPPELLLDATEYGVAVDLWSTGCMPASSPSFSPASPSCPAKPRQINKYYNLNSPSIYHDIIYAWMKWIGI